MVQTGLDGQREVFVLPDIMQREHGCGGQGDLPGQVLMTVSSGELDATKVGETVYCFNRLPVDQG